jgi:hypothetical protein
LRGGDAAQETTKLLDDPGAVQVFGHREVQDTANGQRRGGLFECAVEVVVF